MKQRGGTRMANVKKAVFTVDAGAEFLSVKKICHGSHGLDWKPSRS